MSNTMKRNGSRIEAAAVEVAKSSRDFTVGQVARQAGVSKPTARKYLDILSAAGVLCKWSPMGSNLSLYSFDFIPF